MKHIAIFASGSGTNAQAIIDHFKANNAKGKVALLVSNNSDSYALTRAQNHGIETAVFTRNDFYNNADQILEMLQSRKIDFIVLAGFMLLFPPSIVEAYSDRIVNIHPALLPKYGGKGMYGDNVHKAVIEAREAESGITIHLVNTQYDKGKILFQAKVAVEPTDTPDTLAAKIHKLEHQHFPLIIDQQL